MGELKEQKKGDEEQKKNNNKVNKLVIGKKGS